MNRIYCLSINNLCLTLTHLLLIIRNGDEYIVGSRKRIELAISVLNRGEDAFESMLYLFMPADVNYININKTKNVRIFLWLKNFVPTSN